MITIRKSSERGAAEHGWLSAKHSFSFADYYDPEHMGYSVLRVINEDRVQPGKGFGTHPHKNMEIITYIVSGALEHKDSMGNGSIIRAGDVQYMSAGSGVTHSEFNHSSSELVHLLQIWILPNEKDPQPRYGQIHVDEKQKQGDWKLLASPDGESGSIAIRQKAKMFARLFKESEVASYVPTDGRKLWLHIVKGDLDLNGQRLSTGDSAAVESEKSLQIKSGSSTEVLLFDLPQ